MISKWSKVVPDYMTRDWNGGSSQHISETQGGLTIRELFAAIIMGGLWGAPGAQHAELVDLAKRAINHADILIATLNEEDR